MLEMLRQAMQAKTPPMQSTDEECVLNSRAKISSNWNGDVQLLSKPDNDCVVLVTNSEPCQVTFTFGSEMRVARIDCSSTARNCEIYSDEKYVCTVKAVPESEYFKFKFVLNRVCKVLVIRFLSLRNKSELQVQHIRIRGTKIPVSTDEETRINSTVRQAVSTLSASFNIEMKRIQDKLAALDNRVSSLEVGLQAVNNSDVNKEDMAENEDIVAVLDKLCQRMYLLETSLGKKEILHHP